MSQAICSFVLSYNFVSLPVKRVGKGVSSNPFTA